MKLFYFLEIFLQQSYMHVTLLSRGNFDQTTRISAKVRYKQLSSMGLSCLSMKTLKNHDWMEIS